MRINRNDFIRVLRVVKSVGRNDVKFEEDGSFGIASPNGGSFVFGRGIKIGRKLGIIDVDMMLKMLNAFMETEINIEYDEKESSLSLSNLTNKGVIFGYRLASPELIEGFSNSQKKEFDTAEWVSGKYTFEELAGIKGLIRSLGVGKISFVTEKGRLNLVIGDKKFFYGQVELGDLELDSRKDFLSSTITPILDVIDESKVEIAFRKGVKLIRIKGTDFCWYVGGVDEERLDEKKEVKNGKL